MPTLTVELSAYCNRCGAGICRNVEIDKNMNINIDPCETCLDAEYDRGYSDGHEDGWIKGEEGQ